MEKHENWTCYYEGCLKGFWKEETMTHHLAVVHNIRDAKEQEDLMKRGCFPSNHFWCGYCCHPVPKPEGKDPGDDERMDHLNTHDSRTSWRNVDFGVES